MTRPRVTLHDVSVTGDTGDREAVLAAIEDAVARAAGTNDPDVAQISSQIGSQVSTQVSATVDQGGQR